MNDKNKRLQSEQIDAELRILDDYPQPQVSDGMKTRLQNAVASELAHQHRRHVIFGIVTPLAAAAAIVLAAAVVLNLVNDNAPNGTATVEVATADGEQFNELDWRIDMLIADIEAVGLITTSQTNTDATTTNSADTDSNGFHGIQQQIEELASEFTT